MQIDCPTCARSYRVGPSALGATGRMVVCPACATRWHVAAPYDDARHPINAPSLGTVCATTHDRPARVVKGPPAHRPASKSLHPIAVSVTCVCLMMLVIGKRTAIVVAAPRTAALYAAFGLSVNIRGLEFASLKTLRLDDGAPRVEISGRIRNIAAAHTAVPRITFDVRDARGATLVSWTEAAPKRVLADNESVAFTTQSPSLPAGTTDVVARFDADNGRDTLLIHKAR